MNKDNETPSPNDLGACFRFLRMYEYKLVQLKQMSGCSRGNEGKQKHCLRWPWSAAQNIILSHFIQNIHFIYFILVDFFPWRIFFQTECVSLIYFLFLILFIYSCISSLILFPSQIVRFKKGKEYFLQSKSLSEVCHKYKGVLLFFFFTITKRIKKTLDYNRGSNLCS